MLELSVVICAHNPRPQYLRRVLEALRSQALPKEQWELLLIDNLSSDPLTAQWDLSWHPNGRHILETELGLSAARERGICESCGSVLVFVDDDNVLDPNYLSTARSIGIEWPKLGAWGSGATIPEFELEPAESVKAFLPCLALRNVDVARWGNVAVAESIPWGAGLCVRREIAEAYCRLNERSALKLTGRKGRSLSSADDVEISYVAHHDGFGTGIFPELKLIHLIPKERVSSDYLFKLSQAEYTSWFLLTYKWGGGVSQLSIQITWFIVYVEKFGDQAWLRSAPLFHVYPRGNRGKASDRDNGPVLRAMRHAGDIIVFGWNA